MVGHFVERLVSFVEIRIPEVQERVADAVNNIVKHFYKPEKEVTILVCIVCN